MEDYNSYEDEGYYQIPPKPSLQFDNRIYDNYDYNLIDDTNSSLSHSAPSSQYRHTYINTPPRVSSPVPGRVSSPIPVRVSSPVPARVASPIPSRVVSPNPARVSSPIQQRVSSPVPPRVLSPIPPRIASPIPQRISTSSPRIASPIPTSVQGLNSTVTRNLPNSQLNSNFNYDNVNYDMNTLNYDYDTNFNNNYSNNEIKNLRNSNSLASLRTQVNEVKNLRNANSVNSLNNLRNQQQEQQQLLPQQQQLVPKKTLDIIGTPQDQLQKLIIQAKTITNQLQTLSSHDTQLEIYSEGKLPSYENLVKIVSEKFQVQKEINQASARLLTINYIVNITNFCRTHQLHQNIVEGQKKIAELENTIQVLENFIEDINVENEMNKQTAERLKSSLDDTRAILENAIQEYRKEMNDHRKILKKQNRYIESIQNSKVNQDLLVDAGIFCISLYLVNLPIIDFPIHSVFQTLMQPGRRRAFTKQLAKLIMVILLVRKFRQFAIQYGIHNKIGSFSPYFYKLINLFIPISFQNDIKDMTSFLLKSNDKNTNKRTEVNKPESLNDMTSDIEIITKS